MQPLHAPLFRDLTDRISRERLIALLCVRAALGATPLYRDPTASIAERADDLLARMTTDEKIAQTWAPYGSFDGAAAIGAASAAASAGPSAPPAEPSAASRSGTVPQRCANRRTCAPLK